MAHPQRGVTFRKCDYLLDVVSNGSESLEPTVFLSVLSGGDFSEQHAQGSLSLSGVTVLGRYALLGLGDMTARLVADQKLSWACTKAVFCNNNHKESSSVSAVGTVHGGGLWGLPGLLLALNQAGAPDLTVVTGNEEDAGKVEEMTELLTIHKKYPRLRIASVPLNTQTPRSWWKMYEDDYIVVHATCPVKLEHLIYLVTCRQHQKIDNYTMAVLPCIHAWSVFLDLWQEPSNRVVLGEDAKCLDIHSILAVGEGTAEDLFLSNARKLFPNAHVCFCRPNDSRDPRILLRANEMIKSWNKILPNNIIWREPNQSSCSGCSTDSRGSAVASLRWNLQPFSSILCAQPPIFFDRRKPSQQSSGTTSFDPTETEAQSTLDFFQNLSAVENQSSTIDGKPSLPVAVNDENEIDIDDESDEEAAASNESSETSDRIVEVAVQGNGDDARENGSVGQRLTGSPQNPTSAKGQHCPHLLVLGTGCAAPSPLRGSSGYALLFPQRYEKPASTPPSGNDGPSTDDNLLLLTSIVECGEGVLHMLQRHLPSIGDSMSDLENLYGHLGHVKFIWISHAHWDHYGGLPAVLGAICQARMQRYRQKNRPLQGQKRMKVGSSELPVLVVAPVQVLKYLDSAFRGNDDIRFHASVTGLPLYHGFTHEQNALWWPFLASIIIAGGSQNSSTPIPYRPFAFWANVRVDHSCFGAFGFVTGLRVPCHDLGGAYCGLPPSHAETETPLVTFAYSGDTRPCKRFVDRCRFDCAFNHGILNYLLHEASFDDSEHSQSVQKKHSSLGEALKVASDACAQKTILTHFSQRYTTYPPMELPAESKGVVFAMDGMLFPFSPQ
ncbi:phosphodiesterase ELAC protein 2 [Seminavis robusta]|uniref:ribonuclease Z n=1 Tax=Seminavis robusta TaxID=568900 RepID=A0A9N8EBC1_9STRA|nr:phosphodiesterase ELAC protein 2 [Seminavis robusta]|eukprot:Sro897_g217470.1 phosphodiesterase ELAC protein 2 (837) ;mRNA; r:14387-16897